MSIIMLALAVASLSFPALAQNTAFESSASNSYVAYAARYRVTIQRGQEIQQIIVTSDSSDHAKWAVQKEYYGWTVINVEYLG